MDYRRKSEEAKRLYDEFRSEDAKQMYADFRELMQTPAFRRVLIGMVRRGYLEKSIPDTDNQYALGKVIGYREFAVQLAESAKGADFAMWQLADNERRAIEEERKTRMERVS